MNSAVIGFPRVGKLRELKFATEKYFHGEISQKELQDTARTIRLENWKRQQEYGIRYLSSNDFSFYDNMLDTAVLWNAVPDIYRKLDLNPLDTYFAMARGYQGPAGDVPALAMKKWFNTNYHYMEPELNASTRLQLTGTKPFEEYQEAKEQGIQTKPVLIGPFTFLKLARYTDGKKPEDFTEELGNAYGTLLERFQTLGAEWVQFDEPALVRDLTGEDISLARSLYQHILPHKQSVRVLLQTYFGDVRDCYTELLTWDIDGIGLDFVEGRRTAELVRQGFPADKILFAGLINGKNIWRSHYGKVLQQLKSIRRDCKNVVLSTSCSLLHVPYTVSYETALPKEIRRHFAFAVEKLEELSELCRLAECEDPTAEAEYQASLSIVTAKRAYQDEAVTKRIENLSADQFVRIPSRREREKIQKQALGLPLLPTTTIGSFPQTGEVKKNRKDYRQGLINQEAYEKQIFAFIKDCIEKQEEIGLDVLVHGEFERNDMVEFFGENLSGYVFTEKGWVQSYGTRCVKPPILFGDIKRTHPITVPYSAYAQSLTEKPVKGMLTGPVTILNWSFPREDISLKEMALQIGIAIREEVLDLEKAGIRIIQIDEAALKEKLPIRKSDWYSEYLDWAIPAFRLCHSGVKAETQIHTHMCYSEFNDIIPDIDRMDADVISFEASRSKLTILDALQKNHFETEVGPGVYDIHSPRVPSVEEMTAALLKMLSRIDRDKLWVNPDCGLKTRGWKEVLPSLKNLVQAARKLR